MLDVDQVVREFAAKSRNIEIEPSLIFKLELHPKAYLDDDRLERMGLQVLSRSEDKALVVFSSDAALTSFREHLSQYSGDLTGPSYRELGGIESLSSIAPEDRVGVRLRESPLDDANVTPLDIELWHPGTRAGAERRLEEFSSEATRIGATVSDSVVGSDLLVARVQADSEQLGHMLALDMVREADRIPSPGVVPIDPEDVTADDLPPVPEPPEGSSAVLVVDSGIAANHPLLSSLVGEAAAFPSPNRDPQFGPEDEDRVSGGHGTAVSGRAGFGDVRAAIAGGGVEGVRLFSARVLDDQCSYDPYELAENQLEQAVEYFVAQYPECKVINLSLGDERAVLGEGGRQFRLAARVDEIAYALQDRNILFVISSGNFSYIGLNAEDVVDEYPNYLLDPRARIIDPATSALALTVGGLSLGEAPSAAGRTAIAQRETYPAPFTRSGPGVNDMVKPDVVEYAGDSVVDQDYEPVTDLSVGVVTTNRDFAPPNGQILRRVSGTSFAAPAVANLAARIYSQYTDATPNLVRALIADSAEVPRNRPTGLRQNPWEDEVLNVYGYGKPSFERASKSAENDVLLVAESVIELDSFQLFEIPEIPADFMDTAGDRRLVVSLAFDPPTRQSRGDSYLGVKLGFSGFRNLPLEEIETLYRDWNRAPAGRGEDALTASLSKLPTSKRLKFSPGSQKRFAGTLQKGVASISRANWQYDGGPIIIAVTSQRKWAPEEVVSQRFALVASLKHSDDQVKIHTRLRERLQQRVRATV